MLYKPDHVYFSKLISTTYPHPRCATPTHLPFLLLNIPRMLLLIIICILCFISAFIAFSQVSCVISSFISFRCTKCHLVRKALAIHSTYKGNCLLHHSPIPLSCFSGLCKVLTYSTSTTICSFTFFLNYNVGAMRAGTLLYILLYFQWLEECLTQSRHSVNVCWRINEWSPKLAQGTHILEKFWHMRSFIFNFRWGKGKD